MERDGIGGSRIKLQGHVCKLCGKMLHHDGTAIRLHLKKKHRYNAHSYYLRFIKDGGKIEKLDARRKGREEELVEVMKFKALNE